MNKKKSLDDLLEKLKKYCSVQERCIEDIKNKLSSLNLSQKEINYIIKILTNENFINEKRYAEMYTIDHFNNKNWGKQKIIYHLKNKNIPEEYINSALNNIDNDEYVMKIRKLVSQKIKTYNFLPSEVVYEKLKNWLSSKGFENDEYDEIIREYVFGGNIEKNDLII